jgi:peptidoglycan/LPS O-acetylase OafA/YrhL
MTRQQTAPPTYHALPRAERFDWLLLIKGIAFFFVFGTHLSEHIFGNLLWANPTYDWPPLAVRLAQFQPVTGYGILDIPINLARYIGWNGTQGVQLFLVLSGFGLTWGLLAKYGLGPISVSEFYKRRAWRLYPTWWGAHLLFLVTGTFTGWGLNWSDRLVYVSMLGIRITPDLIYHFTTAWWYFGVMIQLYLVFPLLWAALQRLGPIRFVIAGCALTFASRAIGVLMFGTYMDAWLRGAFFITQLASFTFGMSLAVWFKQSQAQVDCRLRARSTILIAIGMYASGSLLNFWELGLAVSPFLRGVGLFILLYNIFARPFRPRSSAVACLKWFGQHSYALFLMHQPFIALLVPSVLKPSNLGRVVFNSLVAFGLALLGALFLEKVVEKAVGICVRWYKTGGIPGTALRLGTAGCLVVVILFGTEFGVTRIIPQAVLGWGEKPILIPDATLGWRMKPSGTFHLRWDGYDYQVTTNSLGFPGPEYPAQKDANTYRILVIGDGFTSASGVNTEQTWPRLLEAGLSHALPGQRVQIMTFAVTHYGPSQYAALVDQYAPIYHPDLILIGFSAFDYQDSRQDINAVRAQIGFDYPASDSLYAILRTENLEKLVRTQIHDPLEQILTGMPDQNDYGMAGFPMLERDQPTLGNVRQLVAARLSQIKKTAAGLRAQVLIVMIPVPVQVCKPEQLRYYPAGVELNDTSKFDPDLPQRMTTDIARPLQIPVYDLRVVLRSDGGECPYQPQNVHWLPRGHQLAAEYLTQLLSSQIRAASKAQPM